MDFGDFVRTFGPYGAVVLYILWTLNRDARAREKLQNARTTDQDKRDTDIAASFDKIIDVFKQTSQSASDTNARAAVVFDKVMDRLDSRDKEISNALREASEQRTEHGTLLKVMIGQLANPDSRFIKVVENINTPIIKAVEDTGMDVTAKIIKELQDGLHELSTALLKLQGGQDEIKAENAAILDKIEVLKHLVDTLQPTPTAPVTVNVTTPATPTVAIQPDTGKEE